MKKIVEALDRAEFVLQGKPGILALIKVLKKYAEDIPEDAEVPQYVEDALKTIEVSYEKTKKDLN